MIRLKLCFLFMMLGILIMLVDLLWHSPLTMMIFLSAGFGSVAVAILLFGLFVVDTFRVRVSVRDTPPTDKPAE